MEPGLVVVPFGTIQHKEDVEDTHGSLRAIFIHFSSTGLFWTMMRQQEPKPIHVF